jgi:hypothetical protein
MAVKSPTNPKSMLVDKRSLQQALAELNARLGFVKDETATPQKVREMMRADGICPEDNLFSREIIRMRYGRDADEE